MSQLWDDYGVALKAYRHAQSDAIEAKALIGSAAEDIAEQFLETGTADATVLAVYRKAKELAEQKAALAQEAWVIYDRAYRVLNGQQEEEPPAVRTAEGDVKSEAVEIRVADDERILVPRFSLDPERNTGAKKKAKWPVGPMDIHPESLSTLDLLEDCSKHIRADGRVSIVDDLTAVNDFRHEVSFSVGGAPSGSGVGTSESTEGDQTPVVPEMKEPSAGATAEGEETKHSNGK